MIFPNLQLENIIQASDMTRLNARSSFVSKDEASAITKVEIEPEAAAGFIDVSGPLVAGELDPENFFLDWEYAGASRIVTASVRVTAGGAGPTTDTKTIEVITELDDKLFSSDTDLIGHEFDILNWLKPGRNSFLNFHRRAQGLILAHLDREGYIDKDQNKLTKAAFIDLDEGKEWSTFITLRLIWQDASNSKDDKQMKKATLYEATELDSRERAIIRLDLDKDGKLDEGEGVTMTSVGLRRT